jgi:NDP-sugar pyrophosphorylase family protein
MSLPVAILAGGLATRIRPITERIPKQLVEVAGQPFAFHQLRALAASGIDRVVYCLGYLGEQVVEAIGDGSAFGLEVDYVFDGPVLLGTAGAIRGALSKLDDAFFVLYGDSYLDIDYPAVESAFAASNKPALMTVFRNEGRWDTSNVEFDGASIVVYSKTRLRPTMAHIDYGLGAFRAEAFHFPQTEREADLAAVYERLAEVGSLAAYEARARFYEIGSFAGIRELEVRLLDEAGRDRPRR